MTLIPDRLIQLARLYSNSSYTVVVFRPLLQRALSAVVYTDKKDDDDLLEHMTAVKAKYNLKSYELPLRYHIMRGRVPPKIHDDVDFETILGSAMVTYD